MQTGGGVMSSDLRAWAATQPDVGFVDTIHSSTATARLARHP